MVRAVGMKPIGTSHTALSRDGTRIGYLSVGGGQSVLVVPGVLSMAGDYAAFARAPSEHFMVHSWSGSQRYSRVLKQRNFHSSTTSESKEPLHERLPKRLATTF